MGARVVVVRRHVTDPREVGTLRKDVIKVVVAAEVVTRNTAQAVVQAGITVEVAAEVGADIAVLPE